MRERMEDKKTEIKERIEERRQTVEARSEETRTRIFWKLFNRLFIYLKSYGDILKEPVFFIDVLFIITLYRMKLWMKNMS